IHFIGHEVKGFLAKDAGVFATLSEGDLGALPDAVRPFVDRALAQSREGVTAVTDILKASNQKKGTTEYKKEQFNFKQLVADEVEKARPSAEEKGLTLSFVADDADAPYDFVGDRGEIGDHVLRNLIDNAINYTPSGFIAISLKREGGKIIFAVKDSGVGITEEDKKQLFTEGGHGKDSQRVNTHSTGYGLFIAKNIVTAHGGTVRAKSEGAGKGSTFVVEFPIS
ncbi:MAG: HAMP domain-containing histidine kinase, partial [Patescibacteria group bacterium]|nr:HAMP domain-containing histidine kinase [Patescibacteria group bacterium]